MFATFKAAAFEDEAAGVGGISFHEAVLGFALALVRLIRTFGHKLKSYTFIIGKYLVYYTAVFHRNQGVFHNETDKNEKSGKVLPC